MKFSTKKSFVPFLGAHATVWGEFSAGQRRTSKRTRKKKKRERKTVKKRTTHDTVWW